MSRQLAVITILFIGISASLAGCQPRGVIVIADERPQTVEILRRYNGSDPGLKDTALMLIQSGEELKSLGSYDLKVQTFDFERESLLLLALGEKPTGGYWARITGVQKEGDLLYVQGLANRPADDQAVPQVLTYPYDAVVVKKYRGASVRSEIESVVGKYPQEYRGK